MVADRGGVGSGLADHINVPVQYRCLDPSLTFARYQRFERALWLAAQWFLAGTGPGAAPFWSTCLFDGGSDIDWPELQVFFTPMVVKEARDAGDSEDTGLLERLGRRLLVRGSKRAVSGFQFDINLMRPESRGTVRLAGADPLAPPRIDPRFLSGPRDLPTLLAGIRRVRSIVAQTAFDAVRGAELSPGAGNAADAELIHSIRQTANTGHHPVGTCRMGADSDHDRVVDTELRVVGVAGLRVCDASIFPTQITGNPQATVIAIAEKAADLILGRPPLPAADPARRSEP